MVVERPHLVATNLRAEPPATERRPISIVPEIQHDIEAISLGGLLEGRSAVILSNTRKMATDDGANGGVVAP